jgi:hypothetical protein
MKPSRAEAALLDEAFSAMCRRQHERRKHMVAADAAPDVALDAASIDPKVLALMEQYVGVANKVARAEEVLERKEAVIMATHPSRDLRFAADAVDVPPKPKDGDGGMGEVLKRLDDMAAEITKLKGARAAPDIDTDDDDQAVPPKAAVPNPPMEIPGEPSPAVSADNRVRSDSARRLKLAELQGEFDRTLQRWGTSAPRALDGESSRDYRLRLLRPLAKYHGEWKSVGLDSLDGKTLRLAQAQILHAASEASKNPSVPQGTLLSRVRHDEAGRRITEFFGSPSVWLNRGARPRQFLKRISSPGELRMRQDYGLDVRQIPDAHV